MTKRHYYYVTYQYCAGPVQGTNWTEKWLSERITSVEQIEAIARHIRNHHDELGQPLDSMVVLNWIWLRTERGD